MTGIGIIGCGLVGNKRAAQLGGAELVSVFDPMDFNNAYKLAKAVKKNECIVYGDIKDFFDNKDIDVVIVATTHRDLYKYSSEALLAGKHVLVEKPAGYNIQEVIALDQLAKSSGRLVRVGFNHRYHPAIALAKYRVCEIGELFAIRARYGHGGRLGYDKEWRADSALAGGGELLEQGIHIIDLARYFLGDFTKVVGWADTYYWNQKLDDNAHLLLRTADNKIANISVSCTEWRNTFCFEIFGKKGKFVIDGLGGSYGVEKFTQHKVRPIMGPPWTTTQEFPFEDTSWDLEMTLFLEDIKLNRQPDADLISAIKAWECINEVYQQTKELKEIGK